MRLTMNLACAVAAMLLTAWPAAAQEQEQTPPTRRAADVYRQLFKERLKNIDRLHQYHEHGVFPRNYDFPTKVPYFVDAHGTHCAMANLVKESGAVDIVRQVVKLNNQIWIKDVESGPFLEWMLRSGLTLEECARIQPAYYPPPSPPIYPGYPPGYPPPGYPPVGVSIPGYPPSYPGYPPGGTPLPGYPPGYPGYPPVGLPVPGYPPGYPGYPPVGLPVPGYPPGYPGYPPVGLPIPGHPPGFPPVGLPMPPKLIVPQPKPIYFPQPDDKRIKEYLAKVETELKANTLESLQKAMAVCIRNNDVFLGKSYVVVAPPALKMTRATLTLKNPSRCQQVEVTLTFFDGMGGIVEQEIPKFRASENFHVAKLAANKEVQVPYNCDNTWVVVEWTDGPDLNVTVPFQTVADVKALAQSRK